MGMHNSRKLQLEQATLMAWGFMVYLLVEQWTCLGSRLELIPKHLLNLRVYPVGAPIHQKPVEGLTCVNTWRDASGQSHALVKNTF
jgi:hypothetical protein